MKNYTTKAIIRKFSLTILLFIHGLMLQAQLVPKSKFEQVKDHVDGFGLGGGLMIGNLLNRKFVNSVQNGEIKIEPAASLEMEYNKFPFAINFSLFSSKFSLNSSSAQGLVARHTGGEIGVTTALIHSLKRFFPYSGLAAQKGVIGTGILFTGLKDKENSSTPYSVKDLSSVVFKFGAYYQPIDYMAIKLEYRSQLKLSNEPLGFNFYSLQVIFKYK